MAQRKTIAARMRDLAMWMAEQHYAGYDHVEMKLDRTREFRHHVTTCTNEAGDSKSFEVPIYEGVELWCLFLTPAEIEKAVDDIGEEAKQYSHSTYLYARALERRFDFSVPDIISKKVDDLMVAGKYQRFDPELEHWCKVGTKYLEQYN